MAEYVQKLCARDREYHKAFEGMHRHSRDLHGHILRLSKRLEEMTLTPSVAECVPRPMAPSGQRVGLENSHQLVRRRTSHEYNARSRSVLPTRNSSCPQAWSPNRTACPEEFPCHKRACQTRPRGSPRSFSPMIRPKTHILDIVDTSLMLLRPESCASPS